MKTRGRIICWSSSPVREADPDDCRADIDEGDLMSSNRVTSSAARTVRVLATAAGVLTLGVFAGCSESAGRGPGKTGTNNPPPSRTGAAGSVTVPPAGGAGETTIPTAPSGGAGTGTAPTTGAAGTGISIDNPGAPSASCETLTAGAAPPAYVSACSSCHGMTASGRGGYPSLRNDMTLQEFSAIVRAGRTSATLKFTTSQGKVIQARMPSFSAAHLSEAELAAIFAYRSTPASPNLPVPASYCLSRPEASWTPEQIDEAYQRGLTAWRTPGEVDQAACSHCHAADAMDLAFIGYTDGAIYRRAFNHVAQPVVDDVIDMVHAIRARFKITAPPDPITFRPFQPGGEVLPGKNAQERDRSFGLELKKVTPTLMGAPINDATAAHKAWDELGAVNLRTLKIGIPMNRYTEDIYNNDDVAVPCADIHGCDDHGTLADWITDVPVLTAASAAAVHKAQDAYLANPTLETLKAVIKASPRDDVMWFKQKFLATQVGNFLFRQQALGDTLLTKLGPTPFPVEQGYLYNSIWMMAANMRDFIHNVGAALPTGGGKFSVPRDTLPGLTRNNASEQLQRVIVPWFWLGFTFDPSTMNVQPDYVAEGDEYFTQQTFLDSGSSPIHGAFIVSKRSLEMMKYETLPRSPNVFPFYHPDLGRYPVTPMTMRSGYFPVVTNFAEEKNFNTINNYQIKYTPTEPEHRKLYQTYAANQWRMFMWILVDELQTTPQVWNPTILTGKIRKAEIFLTQPEVAAANGAADTALIARARELVGKATVQR
jgi:mono/diheme cytochrome c family protein